MVTIEKKNETFLRIGAELSQHRELSDYFTFAVPEAKFLKQQKLLFLLN